MYAPLTSTQEKYYSSVLNNTIREMVENERKKKLSELGWEKENVEQNLDMNGLACDEEDEEWGVRKSKRLKNKQQK